jgi:hypothetical protein
MTRALGYSAHGAYASSTCHYCGKYAGTADHIVPRSAFEVHQSALPYWYRQHNIAPACSACNEFKGNYRSDCTCAQCEWVWRVALAMFLPADYVVRRRWVIRVGQARL